jgi:predicted transcriptional regulator
VFKAELLKAQMVAKGINAEELADKIGINTITLYRKMNGKTEFTRSEMQIIKAIFNLNKGEMDAIFFAQ